MPWTEIQEWAAEFAIRAEEAGESVEARLARDASAAIAARRKLKGG